MWKLHGPESELFGGAERRRGIEEEERGGVLFEERSYTEKTVSVCLLPGLCSLFLASPDLWACPLLGYRRSQWVFITLSGRDALPDLGLDSEPSANASTE